MQTKSNCKAPSIAVVKVEKKNLYSVPGAWNQHHTIKKRRNYNLQASTKQAKRKRDHPDGERERLAMSATTW